MGIFRQPLFQVVGFGQDIWDWNRIFTLLVIQGWVDGYTDTLTCTLLQRDPPRGLH